MNQEELKYHRDFMRRHRAKKRWAKALARGHCPVCDMLLKSKYHFDCKYLDKEDKSTPF